MVKPVDLNQIKTLREATGVGIMEAKKALTEAGGEVKKATELLKKWGAEKLAGRQDKETKEGQVFAYVHSGGRIGALVEVNCETDFVARSAEFQTLGKELALQVASMEPKTVKGLLKQTYIRDSSKKVTDLIAELAVKVKEKIIISAFDRFAI